MKVAFLLVGQQISLALFSSLRTVIIWGKKHFSQSFTMDSHIKNPSNIEKKAVCKCECEVRRNTVFEHSKEHAERPKSERG